MFYFYFDVPGVTLTTKTIYSHHSNKNTISRTGPRACQRKSITIAVLIMD